MLPKKDDAAERPPCQTAKNRRSSGNARLYLPNVCAWTNRCDDENGQREKIEEYIGTTRYPTSTRNSCFELGGCQWPLSNSSYHQSPFLANTTGMTIMLGRFHLHAFRCLRQILETTSRITEGMYSPEDTTTLQTEWSLESCTKACTDILCFSFDWPKNRRV